MSNNSNNKANNKISKLKINDKYKILSPLNGYRTSDDAKNHKNKRTVVKAGTYFIHNIHNGMINVTQNKHKPGSWINPSNNKKKNNSNKSTPSSKKSSSKNNRTTSGKPTKNKKRPVTGISTICGPYEIDTIPCYIINMLTKTKIEFELPDDLSDSSSASFDDEAIRGRSTPIKGYDSSGPRTISFSMTLYDDLCNKGLAKTIALLKAFTYPGYDGQVNAPYCYIRIGKAVKGLFVINSVGVNYQKPYRDGNYVSAEVSMDLSESPDTAYSVTEIEKGSGMWK